MALTWVERYGFLVRYIAYRNSRYRDAEEINFSHVWEPKGDSVYRYRNIYIFEKIRWN